MGYRASSLLRDAGKRTARISSGLLPVAIAVGGEEKRAVALGWDSGNSPRAIASNAGVIAIAAAMVRRLSKGGEDKGEAARGEAGNKETPSGYPVHGRGIVDTRRERRERRVSLVWPLRFLLSAPMVHTHLKAEKGKPRESGGRKATGLRPALAG